MIPLPIPYVDDNPLEGDKEPVLALMLAGAFASVFWKPEWYALLGFTPASPHWWALLTAPFLHVGGFHLVINSWMLWLFGDNVSKYMGSKFWAFYFTCAAASIATHAIFRSGSTLPAVGSNAAVVGVAAAYMVLFPRARVRCVVIGPRTGVRFTLSALLFGIPFLIGQALFMFGGVMKPVDVLGHAGGLLVGLVWAFAVRRPGAGQAVSLSLSGAAGVKPLAAAATLGEGAVIEAAICERRESDALDGFAAALRRNPAFELSPDAQLWAADRLARAGHPHMARSALERFVAGHPDGPNLPHAWTLLGYIHQAFLLDFDAAAGCYRQACQSPAASSALIHDAEARLAQVETLLRRTFTEAPRENEKYAVVMEGARPPSAEHARLIAEAAGDIAEHVAERLATVPGFVLRWLSAAESGELAQRLEAADFPVIVTAEGSLVKLAGAIAASAPTAADNGLRIKAEGLDVLVPWEDCLLVSAGGVGMPKSTEKQKGLLEIADFAVSFYGLSRGRGYDFGRTRRLREGQSRSLRRLFFGSSDDKEYETSSVHIPVLELVLKSGVRYRWTPTPDMVVEDAQLQSFFDVLQDLIIAAPSVPVERGALAAFERAVPPSSMFLNIEAWDAYLFWQVQLAASKRCQQLLKV